MSASSPEGLQKIAEGREAELYAWGEGRVLRLFHHGRSASDAERHAHFLGAIRASGIRAPEVFGLESVDGRQGIVMERLAGADLLTAMGKQPWRLFSIAATCARVQAAMNSKPAPDGLPSTHDSLAPYILNIEHVPPKLAEAAIARLKDLPRGDRLLHGDYHPGNLMLHRGEPVVIDWSNATAGPPEADYARTRLLMSMGSPPPGTPALVHILRAVGGSLFGALYGREYRRRHPVDERLVDAWRLPIAVGRLSEGIVEEREKLLRLAATALREA